MAICTSDAYVRPDRALTDPDRQHDGQGRGAHARGCSPVARELSNRPPGPLGNPAVKIDGPRPGVMDGVSELRKRR
jgi:hypothetical protein